MSLAPLLSHHARLWTQFQIFTLALQKWGHAGGQLTTFQKADMYSGRLFWYFK